MISCEFQTKSATPTPEPDMEVTWPPMGAEFQLGQLDWVCDVSSSHCHRLLRGSCVALWAPMIR